MYISGIPNYSTRNNQFQNGYGKTVSVQILDGQGKNILHQRLMQGLNVVSVEKLATGLYFFQVVEAGVKLHSGSFIKE